MQSAGTPFSRLHIECVTIRQNALKHDLGELHPESESWLYQLLAHIAEA